MLEAAALAFRHILSPPFRGVLWKSVSLTLALLAGLWLVVQWLVARYVDLPYAWMETALSILTGAGLIVGLGFLIAPVTALFAGLFLDQVAEEVERRHYPQEPVGRPPPFGPSLVTSLRFLGVVLLVNAVALPLVLFAGFGFVIFLVANAYLLGREYFEQAARRFHSEEVVQRIRARNSRQIFAAGLLIAAFVAVPVLNLLAPLFATAFMVHMQKRIAAGELDAVPRSA